MIIGLVKTIKETVSDLQDASEAAGKIEDKDKRLKVREIIKVRSFNLKTRSVTQPIKKGWAGTAGKYRR